MENAPCSLVIRSRIPRKLGILLSLCVSASMLRAQGMAADYERSAHCLSVGRERSFVTEMSAMVARGKSLLVSQRLGYCFSTVFIDAVKGSRELALTTRRLPPLEM